jgi:predicted dehydrogenase
MLRDAWLLTTVERETEMSGQTRFGVVGGGWRAQFFLKLAGLLPERLAVAGVVVRRADAADEVSRRWGVPAYLSLGELTNTAPDFVVSAVPWAATPGVVAEAVAVGVPVLSETPPAPDRDRLRALWRDVGGTGLVQVAEQYLLLPGHAARRELVRRGLIGQPTSVQVSSTHLYHAVSMMRGLLGVGFEPATVDARAFVAPLVDPQTRAGWVGDSAPKDATTTIATIDFGGAMGLYDFTDNQWHNQLRMRRIVIRGTHGEIVDDAVVRLTDAETIVRSALVRRQSGYDLDLDGYDTEHISIDGDVVYRNPFVGLRLADEEIAIATQLVQMAAWCRDEGPPPYPLAEACQDHLVGLAIEESVARGEPVTTTKEPWAAS